jgi:HD-GYP domain-containing protein (c-di-GMP phosphodiesterase class II)
MFRAAPLHDIGKVGIPDSILCKSGQLTIDEWEVMKTHPLIGEAMLKSAALVTEEDHVMSVAIKIAGGHHEKWDGTGYPRGLKSGQIPLAARIMSLSDVYDALISERVYKKQWTHEQAVEEIVSKKGIAFDPAIVDAFVLEANNFRQISGNYPDDILLVTDKS